MAYSENEQGFTLIEVIVAFSIITLVMVPLLQILYFNEKVSTEVRAEDVALFLAQAKMEELKSYNFESLVNTSKTAFPGHPGYFYTVSIEPESDFLKRIIITISYGPEGKEKELLLTGYKAKT